ncbi:MAG: DUF6702 family protein, partial [Candidatus Thermochlorobacter sp.]
TLQTLQTMNMRLIFLLLFFLLPCPVHNFHVSYTKIAVEQNIAVMNVRFFIDDLELALQRRFNLTDFKLSATPLCDSLYLSYFNQHFELHNNGSVIRPTLLSSGIDKDMWWYQLQFSSPQPMQHLSIKNTLLFDVFDDQKNIVQIMHFPSEKLESFYFIHGAERYQFSCP